MALGVFLCESIHSIHSIHISSCYVTEGAGMQDIQWSSGNNGLQFTMFGSHTLLQVWGMQEDGALTAFRKPVFRPLLGEPCRRLLCDKCLHLTLEFVSPETMGPDYEPTLNIIIHTYLQIVREA